MKKFWMIWNPGKRVPAVQHPGETNARSEAARLARANPGQTFVVLESIADVQKNDLSWEEHFTKDIPF